MFFGKPRGKKKINLFSLHRSNERCENCWFVRKCKERRHRIKKLNLPSRLTFTLKAKPRTIKSHQTIFATRRKEPLPLLKKKEETGGKKKNQGHLYTKGNSQRTWSLQFLYTL